MHPSVGFGRKEVLSASIAIREPMGEKVIEGSSLCTSYSFAAKLIAALLFTSCSIPGQIRRRRSGLSFWSHLTQKKTPSEEPSAPPFSSPLFLVHSISLPRFLSSALALPLFLFIPLFVVRRAGILKSASRILSDGTTKHAKDFDHSIVASK